MGADPDRSMLPLPRSESKATTGPVPVQETTAVAVQKNDAIGKPPRQLQRLPPISGGGGGLGADDRKNNGTTATAGAEHAARAWMRQALAKRIATRMLKQSTAARPVATTDEGTSGGRKVLACCCARLPPGLDCALHQAAAPGRSWMRVPRRGGASRGEGGAAVALAAPRAFGWAFSEYARWRRHVWMPSRFYLEHVGED